MTRAKRAACELALALLRSGAALASGTAQAFEDVDNAETAIGLSSGGGALIRAIEAGLDVLDARVIRARLALYLRALLRADRGDVGPEHACTACRPPSAIIDARICGFCRSRSRHTTPLREAASGRARWIDEEHVDARGWRTSGRWVRT